MENTIFIHEWSIVVLEKERRGSERVSFLIRIN